jgi:hypothetical protein
MSESSNEYSVVWPLSRQQITSVGETAGVGSLDNKRVAFVWDYMFRGDEMWELIKEGIRDRYPTAEFVGYEAFGNIHGPSETGVPSDLLDNVRRERVDAAVLAVGA